MTDNQKSKRPAYEAFVIEGEGRKSFWTKIGACWPHDDGEGFTLNLVALPIDGRISLRVPREDKRDGNKDREGAR